MWIIGRVGCIAIRAIIWFIRIIWLIGIIWFIEIIGMIEITGSIYITGITENIDIIGNTDTIGSISENDLSACVDHRYQRDHSDQRTLKTS